MRRLFIRSVMIALFLLAVPNTQFAQQPRFIQNGSTIEFDITEIANFDERVFFLHSLVNDSRFNVVDSEQDGIFIISADVAYQGMDLLNTFKGFLKDNKASFSKMDKEQASETALALKSELPNDFVLSLMMDKYIESRENDHCATADPFCTDNGLYEFPAGVNTGSGESGPNYDCLHTTPNPAWYYMKIKNPGAINIFMYSTPSLDIDFCCWGPFSDPVSPCPNGLTLAKRVSCSYSSSATETCNIPSYAQAGDYYILVITNYSNQSCNISFSKTGGTGTTDCGIMPPLVDGGGPYCAGQTIHLTAVGQTGATYSWTGPNNFQSNLQNPTIPNCTPAMAGVYTCTIAVGNQTNSASTESVAVYANPNANAGEDQTVAYPGATAQLHGTGGAGSFDFHWEPANMIAQQGQNAITQPLYQETEFTLTVTNPQGECSDTDQIIVHIGGTAMTATATATMTDICNGENTQLQANAGGGSGNFSYSWSPANTLNHSNIYNPIATPTQTTTYTCHVTDVSAQTSQDVSVTIHVHNSSTSQITQYICPGTSYDFHGNLCSDEGDYQFPASTIYGCDSTITLHLHHYPSYSNAHTTTQYICHGDSYNFHGHSYDSTGLYSENLHTVHGCDSIVWLNLTVYPDNGVTMHPWTTCEADLPYVFNGVSFNQAVDTVFTLQDIHGCDSLVRLVLTINEYTILPTEAHYLCYEGNTPPPFTWEANGQTYEGNDIIQTAILPYGNCQGIYSLEVHQIRKPEVVHIYDTACDRFEWIVEGVLVDQYLTSGTYDYSIPLYYDPNDISTRFECDREYVLHLIVNYSSQGRQTVTNQCDAVDFDWFGTHYEFDRDGEYAFENGLTTHGCDSTFILTIENMMYTPKPEIICQDNGVAHPHYPITSTEFIISQYNYSAIDPQSEQTWQNSKCKWSISKESWPIEISSDNRSCTVYALDWVPDTVWLSFTAFNPCSSEEGITTRYFLKPSFYGVQEQEYYPAAVEIFPNPNDGQMQIRFENMEGNLSIKVFGITGILTDSFEVATDKVGETYNYSMKRLGNGVYFFVITDGKRSVTKKVVIIN